MTKPVAMAIAAHPDDIEFVMAGTLCLLREAGWATHYLNVSSGSGGSLVHGAAAVQPTIVLTHSPQDYMEDHTNVSRLAVTAAFARGIPNFVSRPRRAAWGGACTVYHAMPHGLIDPLRRRVTAGAYVDTTSVQPAKLAALACHESQHRWLQSTQGMNSYLREMEATSRKVGRLSRRFAHAEGWRRHSHLGFCAEGADPLGDALGKKYLINAAYERSLARG